MDMILLDFSKAFDKVPHNTQVESLCMVFRDKPYLGSKLSWPDALNLWFLKEWSLRQSQWYLVSLKAGTVLGPTLCLVYINDLPLQVSSSTTRLFADDCISWNWYSPADAKLLQHDLDALQNWERTWLMSFNPKRCSAMSFRPRPCRNSHNIEYTIHETVLTPSKTYKYLGLHLSDDFWTTHISRITKKAYQQLCFVRRIIQRNCL